MCRSSPTLAQVSRFYVIISIVGWVWAAVVFIGLLVIVRRGKGGLQ